MKPSPLNKKFDEYVAKLPHTGFDLSRDFYFTSAPGMILPVWQHVLQPSEKIRFSCSMKTQSGNTVRPAMLNIPQKIDLFFVPFDMIYTSFGNIFYQTNDFISSGMTNQTHTDAQAGNFPAPDWENSMGIDAMTDFFGNDSQNLHIAGSTLASNFEGIGKSRYRLLQHLGYSAPSIFMNASDKPQDFFLPAYTPSVMPFMAAAYQAIYENYYRDDDREPRDLSSYQMDLYNNADFLQSNVFTLRYHSFFRDYFQSLRVSPIASSLNLINASDSTAALSKCLNYLDDFSIKTSDGTVQGDGGIVSVHKLSTNLTQSTEFVGYNESLGTYPNFVRGSSLSTGLIRSLFAVEKLNRISGRARKNYDSQVLAHLGYKVPTDVKHQIRYLGGFDGNVGVKDVISTADTSSDGVSNLGERAGFGVGSLGGSPIEFTAPCHGIVMAVYFSVPEFSSPVNRQFDKLNALSDRLSFPQPEFDRLGMQPLYAFENNVQPQTTYSNMSIGWQYRYEQFKRKHDIHTVVFDKYQTNTWSPWVVGKLPIEGTAFSDSGATVSLASFLCNPSCLNDIFVQQYDPMNGDAATYVESYGAEWYNKPSVWYQSDPFMHALRVNCQLVSFMSTTGEPELI